MYFPPTQWQKNKILTCALALNTWSNFRVCPCFEQRVGPDHIQDSHPTWIILYFLLPLHSGLSVCGDWRRADPVRFWKVLNLWLLSSNNPWLCTLLGVSLQDVLLLAGSVILTVARLFWMCAGTTAGSTGMFWQLQGSASTESRPFLGSAQKSSSYLKPQIFSLLLLQFSFSLHPGNGLCGTKLLAWTKPWHRITLKSQPW